MLGESTREDMSRLTREHIDIRMPFLRHMSFVIAQCIVGHNMYSGKYHEEYVDFSGSKTASMNNEQIYMLKKLRTEVTSPFIAATLLRDIDY
jgi:hypothetical protein